MRTRAKLAIGVSKEMIHPRLDDGHNIRSLGDGCGFNDPSDQAKVLPGAVNLAPIVQDNGGPTETQALLPGSVAIDAIPPEDAPSASTQSRCQRSASVGA